MAHTKPYSEDELREACLVALGASASGPFGVGAGLDVRAYTDPRAYNHVANQLGVEQDSPLRENTLKDAEEMMMEIWGEDIEAGNWD